MPPDQMLPYCSNVEDRQWKITNWGHKPETLHYNSMFWCVKETPFRNRVTKIIFTAVYRIPRNFSYQTWQLTGWTCAGALRHGPGFHTGLLGDGHCVVGWLSGAGAGGGVPPQQTLHVIQLRPCTAELTVSIKLQTASRWIWARNRTRCIMNTFRKYSDSLLK